MGKNVEEKVIRPPVKQITSGKIFKPSQSFLHKMLFQSVLLFILVWLMAVLSFVGIAYIAATDPTNPSAAKIISDWIVPVNLWTIAANLVWLLPEP